MLESKGWPDENYENSADCRWTIQVDELVYSSVVLTLVSFDMEQE